MSNTSRLDTYKNTAKYLIIRYLAFFMLSIWASRFGSAHCRTMVRLGAQLPRVGLSAPSPSGHFISFMPFGGSATIPLAARPLGAKIWNQHFSNFGTQITQIFKDFKQCL
jgi:hypothetical protein